MPRGRDAVVKMFLGRFTVLGPSNHVTHDRIVRFDEANPDLAQGIVLSHAEMQRKGQPMVTAIRYLDHYRRDAGAWRFAERVLTFMYYVPTAEYLDAFGPGHRQAHARLRRAGAGRLAGESADVAQLLRTLSFVCRRDGRATSIVKRCAAQLLENDQATAVPPA